MVTIIAIVCGLLNVVFIGLRVVESIYELRKNPDLDTWQEVVQVVKNFFSIERYETK